MFIFVFLQIIFVHNSLVTNCAGRGMVILDMVQKDFTVVDFLITQWTRRVVVVRLFYVEFQFAFLTK